MTPSRPTNIPLRHLAAMISIAVACVAVFGLAVYAAASAPPRVAAIQIALLLLVLWHLMHRVTDVRLRVAWSRLAPAPRRR